MSKCEICEGRGRGKYHNDPCPRCNGTGHFFTQPEAIKLKERLDYAEKFINDFGESKIYERSRDKKFIK